MSGFQAWSHRFGSRLRKWWRDPAAFADELPSPRMRALTIFGMGGVTLISDALDLRGGLAGWSWRLRGVSLARAGGEAHEYRFLGRDGRPPAVWPQRVQVRGEGVRAVVVAFADAHDRMTAAEIGQGLPGVIALCGQPAHAEIYRIDGTGELPARLEVLPLGRGGLVRELLRSGLAYAGAIRAAWPPVERRVSAPSARAYAAWIARNEPDPAALEAWRGRLAQNAGLPSVAVVMPVHDPRPAHLRAAIASVLAQVHPNWRLCIADDGCANAEVRRVLAAAAQDPRVRMVRREAAQGVAAATNAALELAEEDIVVFLDHDDELAPRALAMVAEALAADPRAVAVYSDEDTIDARGRRSAPLFKPDLDRERLQAQNYVNHLFAVRRSALLALGGLRAGLDGAQDHDLVLRLIDSGLGRILHLPHVLYHWRSYPGGGSLSQKRRARIEPARARLVHEHLARRGAKAELQPGPNGHLHVHRTLPEPPPPVLAIVPTRDRPGLLRACVAGLLEQTDYPGLEVCIVDNGSRSEEALALLARLAQTPRVRVLRIDAPFNFSALNNAAARGARTPLLAFINDDVMVVEPGWLEAMAAIAVEPDVGAVGAKLYYPDGRIQHAGIVLGVGPQRVAGHEFRGAPGDSPGPQNRLLLTRETSAVTAACMVIERAKFEAVGGFEEEAFPVAFNDVDLCLRLGQAGLRTIWTPQAQLMHLESATRGSDKAKEASARFAAEVARMHERWGPALRADPFYNPNLTLEDESFTLADRPRA